MPIVYFTPVDGGNDYEAPNLVPGCRSSDDYDVDAHGPMAGGRDTTIVLTLGGCTCYGESRGTPGHCWLLAPGRRHMVNRRLPSLSHGP